MEHPEQRLPRHGASGEATDVNDAGTSREHPGDPAAPNSHETILVVENEDNNRRLIEQILGFAGYHCLSATNGLEALDVLDRTHVDLILIDLSMPVLDGFRATEIIRKRPDGATLPIVAVTAHAMSEDRELALRCGCDDYLIKPFRPHELLGVVKRLLGRPPTSAQNI
jgi:CheY-like chemotaxis protein